MFWNSLSIFWKSPSMFWNGFSMEGMIPSMAIGSASMEKNLSAAETVFRNMEEVFLSMFWNLSSIFMKIKNKE